MQTLGIKGITGTHLAIAALTLGFAVIEPSAHAAKAKSLERYSATVEDGTAKVIRGHTQVEAADNVEPTLESEELSSEEAAPEVAAEEKPAEKAEKKPAEKQAVSAVAKSADVEDEKAFDAVPKKRIPELSERMIYAYEILKRYGRAYDYRVTTLKELRKVLSELEKQDRSKSKGA